jgi:hypothetical protein
VALAVALSFSLYGQLAPGPLRDSIYLLMPEPAALRSKLSFKPKGAERTVFTPAKEVPGSKTGYEIYAEEDFAKLGISLATFAERAGAAADARLKIAQPEFIKDGEGHTRYAVFRGDSQLIASLVTAPSLMKTLYPLLGKDLWALLPDRHSLFVFPAKPELVAEFTEDLADRYDTSLEAASCEVFQLHEGKVPSVVGSFGK